MTAPPYMRLPQMVVIGASTGGPSAIYEVLSRLPSDTPGVLVVQHISAWLGYDANSDVSTHRDTSDAAVVTPAHLVSRVAQVTLRWRRAVASLRTRDNVRVVRRALLVSWLGACSVGPSSPVATRPVPSMSARPAEQKSSSFTDAEPLTFAVHPLHNPLRLYRVFQPLAEFVERRCGFALQVEASRSYEAFEAKLAARQAYLALPNPYQLAVARRAGYHVIAKQADDERFRGLLITRVDAELSDVRQLRGSTIAFPARTALAATMMPQLFLAERGLLPDRDYRPLFVGSQESVITSVLLRRVLVGATWPVPWDAYRVEHPASAAELRVAWQTPSLVNNAVVARADVPAARVECVRATLVGLSNDDEGQRLLAVIGVSAFEPADDATYAPVDAFLQAYLRAVGPLP